MSAKLTKAECELLSDVAVHRRRPFPRDAAWDLFISLHDAGFVEDLGLGDARITARGRLILKARIAERATTQGGA